MYSLKIKLTSHFDISSKWTGCVSNQRKLKIRNPFSIARLINPANLDRTRRVHRGLEIAALSKLAIPFVQNLGGVDGYFGQDNVVIVENVYHA